MRLNKIQLTMKKSTIGIVSCTLVLWGLSVLENLAGVEGHTAWYYNNPVVILMAVFVLQFFMGIQFSSRIVNELAKATFTCFLFHGAFMTHLMIETMVKKNIFVVILHQFVVSIGLYLLSYVVYKIWYLCSHWFIKIITPLSNKVSLSVDTDS